DQLRFAPADRRRVLQPGQPARRELAPPLRHRLDRHPQRLRRSGIRHPLRTRQDDPRPVSPPDPRPPRPAHQLSPLLFRQHDRHSRRTGMGHTRRLAARKHTPKYSRRTTLVCSVIPGLPQLPAIIWGIAAPRQTRRTGEGGTALAVAGLAIATLALL